MELHELNAHRQLVANVSSATIQLTTLSNEVAQVHGTTSSPVKLVLKAAAEMRKAERAMAQMTYKAIEGLDEPAKDV